MRVAVPVYKGQPGWSYLGGARPPPQSGKLQISPVPGTYQIMLASLYWLTVADEVQPLRSVRATAMPARTERTREVLNDFILTGLWVSQ